MSVPEVRLKREVATLDDLERELERALHPGIRISQMAPGERVRIYTRNSVYELVMLQPTQQKIFISGGRHFPHLTEANLVGCSERGGRGDWIALGRRLEIAVGRRLFVTSSIVKIQREAEDAGVALRQAVPAGPGDTLEDFHAEALLWPRWSPVLP